MPVNYLELPDYLLIAEAVLDVSAKRLAEMPHLVHLAESALAVPRTAWGGQEAYPEFAQKAAILCARLAKNHPLWDGNKRVAWVAMREFIERNGRSLRVEEGEAGLVVDIMVKVAAGEMPEQDFVDWVRARLIPYVVAEPRGEVLVLRLLEAEVPEIAAGTVQVRAIAREPGLRTKIAVSSSEPGIDPVGACVGPKGVRHRSLLAELGNEQVDIVHWDAEPQKFVAAALGPATVVAVAIDSDTRTAHVRVPKDQLSLAIGRDGQNARLAAKLTGWRVDIKPAENATGDFATPDTGPAHECAG